MNGPKVTLAQIIEQIRARGTTPELELALVEFLDLPDSEQKVLIFREIVNLSAKINYLLARLGA